MIIEFSGERPICPYCNKVCRLNKYDEYNCLTKNCTLNYFFFKKESKQLECSSIQIHEKYFYVHITNDYIRNKTQIIDYKSNKMYNFELYEFDMKNLEQLKQQIRSMVLFND